LNYSRIISVVGKDQQTTDNVIPSDSCHPQEHILEAIRYITERMETYNLSATNKQKESNTIKQILYNNKYNTSLLNKFTPAENKTRLDKKDTETKWAKFTYFGKKNSLLNS
jgi:DNA replication protein DnaD